MADARYELLGGGVVVVGRDRVESIGTWTDQLTAEPRALLIMKSGPSHALMASYDAVVRSDWWRDAPEETTLTSKRVLREWDVLTALLNPLLLDPRDTREQALARAIAAADEGRNLSDLLRPYLEDGESVGQALVRIMRERVDVHGMLRAAGAPSEGTAAARLRALVEAKVAAERALGERVDELLKIEKLLDGAGDGMYEGTAAERVERFVHQVKRCRAALDAERIVATDAQSLFAQAKRTKEIFQKVEVLNPADALDVSATELVSRWEGLREVAHLQQEELRHRADKIAELDRLVAKLRETERYAREASKRWEDVLSLVRPHSIMGDNYMDVLRKLVREGAKHIRRGSPSDPSAREAELRAALDALESQVAAVHDMVLGS